MRIPTIEGQIKKKFKTAATQIQRDADEAITSSFNQFYAQGYPVMYQRAGILPSAKKIEASIGEVSATITAGYDAGQLGYTSPRVFTADGHVQGGTGSFGNQQVLDATMSGSYFVQGDSSYDDQALQKVIQAAEKRMSAAFG